MRTQIEPNNFLINDVIVNGNNEGSLLSNKEFHICYFILSIDLRQNNKKFIGCFINPNDLILDKNIEKNIYYFQITLPLQKQFTILELLKSTLYSKNYSNYMAKKILKENPNSIIKKMITKCEEQLIKNY